MTSKRIQTALAYLDTFETLDENANVALRAPNCRHQMAPSSIASDTSMNNEQWLDHFRRIKPLLVAFPVKTKEIFEHGADCNSVTIWTVSDAIFSEEAKDNNEPAVNWSYEGEYIWVFEFNETGDKITRIVEFLDSQKVVEVRKLFERAHKNIASKRNSAT